MNITAISITTRHPVACDPNRRLHWAKKASETKAERQAAWALWKGMSAGRTFRWPRCTVEIDWHAKDKRGIRDLDNTIACCKTVMDGAEDAGIYVNDRCIESMTVKRAVTGKDEVTVTVRLAQGESK